MVRHSSNPSTWEVEVGGLVIVGYLASSRPVSQKKKAFKRKENKGLGGEVWVKCLQGAEDLFS